MWALTWSSTIYIYRERERRFLSMCSPLVRNGLENSFGSLFSCLIICSLYLVGRLKKVRVFISAEFLAIVVAHQTAIGDTTVAIPPCSAIPSREQLELRYPLPLPRFSCDKANLRGGGGGGIARYHPASKGVWQKK